jgi:hypothetical protein
LFIAAGRITNLSVWEVYVFGFKVQAFYRGDAVSSQVGTEVCVCLLLQDLVKSCAQK